MILSGAWLKDTFRYKYLIAVDKLTVKGTNEKNEKSRTIQTEIMIFKNST